MSTEARIFYRIIGETCKGISRTRWMNIVIITTMAAILSIFGCLLKSSLIVSSFVNHLGDSMEISVYLKSGYSAKSTSQNIAKHDSVKSTRIISKEQAWKDMKKQMEIPNIKNPLPDTVRVRLKDNANVDNFIKSVKKLSSVESVQYAKELSDKIGQIGNFINTAAIIVIIVLGGLTLSIINNTIYLVIESRKQEIEIMKIMGVSSWYIRAPYIFQGAFYGFCGALLSIIPLSMLNSYFAKFLEMFYVKMLPASTNMVIFTVVVMGVAFGALGSLIAVRKHLKV